MLREIARKTHARTGRTQLYAEDFLDDGSKVALGIDINQLEVRSLHYMQQSVASWYFVS